MNKSNRHQTIQPVKLAPIMKVINSDQTGAQIVSGYRGEAVTSICQLVTTLLEKPVAKEMSDEDLQEAALLCEVAADRIRRYQKARVHNGPRDVA
ncbi:MAG: hypothetical protein OEY01_10855 [Desulfobulbaceae bacterium]|nr:hypothetical protein [Desulfobulbaceae bacterium]